MAYDYEKFHQKYGADVHDDPARHGKISELCHGFVMDIGCGSGTLADYYLGQYEGYDIAETAIAKAHEIRRGDAMFVRCDCANGEMLNFHGADTIVISEFLEHIYDDTQLIEKIKQTARRGTRLIVSVPNDHAFDCDEHVRYFTVPELRKKFSPLGHVQFHNWSGASGQIILTVEIGEFEQTWCSLVMIVKNEEKGLERAILSAIEHVDEIVIAIDSSSSDNTMQIAAKYADKTGIFVWQDDFSGARNFVDSMATGELRFFLDGHEYLEKCNGFVPHDRGLHDGWLCTIEMENGLKFQNPRLYRRGVKFAGAVHEKQQCTSVGTMPGILIKHNRIDGQDDEAAAERKKQRDDMVPRIMGAQLKEDPTNTRALFHLHLHAWSTKKYRKAIKYAKKYLKYSTCAGERWFVLFNTAISYLAQGNKFRAWWAINKADDEEPGRWETEKMKGMILFDAGKYNKAIDWLIASFHENKKPSAYLPWQHDSAGTWNLIAQAYWQLHDYERAALAFDGAREQSKDKTLKTLYEKRVSLMRDMFMEQQRRQMDLTK